MRSTVPSSATSGPVVAGADSAGTAVSGRDVDAYRVPPVGPVVRASGASSAPQTAGTTMVVGALTLRQEICHVDRARPHHRPLARQGSLGALLRRDVRAGIHGRARPFRARLR